MARCHPLQLPAPAAWRPASARRHPSPPTNRRVRAPLLLQTVKPKLTEEQKANLRTCFRMMDADGSGAIDAEELGAAFKLLGLSVSRKEVEAMLAEVDRDGSGEAAAHACCALGTAGTPVAGRQCLHAPPPS